MSAYLPKIVYFQDFVVASFGFGVVFDVDTGATSHFGQEFFFSFFFFKIDNGYKDV